MKQWDSQFANNPDRDYDLYLELLESDEAIGEIARGGDGELYLSLFACPKVRIPYRWLVSLSARAETLPMVGNENEPPR